MAGNGMIRMLRGTSDKVAKSTVLKCHIYLNGTEITPTSGTTFSWIRSSNNEEEDTKWNAVHANKTESTITITTSDLDGNAQFSCEVNIP